MYPWHKTLQSWADRTGLRIDALGLVTILGTEEVDRSIGRLVSSVYLDYLPLLGAFIVAGNRFTKKQPGFTIYNISAGITTTEVAGWFSRWIKSQHLHQVRSKVTFQVEENRPPRWTAILVSFLLIGLPCNAMLIALTVLTEDWWGFANAVAMVVSVLVRCALVAQNQGGINANIKAAGKGAGADKAAKVIVVTDESKVVTIDAPLHLIRPLFTPSYTVPNPYAYTFFRWIGWLAFAVHIISIGMSALYTQICTVVLLIVATVGTANNLGCDDSRAWKTFSSIWKHIDEDEEYDCWVTSSLKATISAYPRDFSSWEETKSAEINPKPEAAEEMPTVSETKSVGENIVVDLESNPQRNEAGKKALKPERRQDLYVWLGLTEEEDQCMTAWGLIPHNKEWVAEYKANKVLHSKRILSNKGKLPDGRRPR